MVKEYTKTTLGSLLSLPLNPQEDDLYHFLAVAVSTVKDIPHITKNDMTCEYDAQFLNGGRIKAKSHFTNRKLRMDHIHELRDSVFPDPDCSADRAPRLSRKEQALLHFGEFMIRRIRQNFVDIHQPRRRNQLLRVLFDEYTNEKFRMDNSFGLAISHMANTGLNNTGAD